MYHHIGEKNAAIYYICCFSKKFELLKSTLTVRGICSAVNRSISCSVSDGLQWMSAHPQQVSGDVALVVATSSPPPLRLHLILPSQHRHAVSLDEAELVITLRLVVPQCVHHTAVHHAHLLLNACRDTFRNGSSIITFRLKPVLKVSALFFSLAFFSWF